MKPCPFCGGMPHIENVPHRVRVVCGACGTGTEGCVCVSDAKIVWDMRVQDGNVPPVYRIAAELTSREVPRD